jgi:hypothetical protein
MRVRVSRENFVMSVRPTARMNEQRAHQTDFRPI